MLQCGYAHKGQVTCPFLHAVVQANLLRHSMDVEALLVLAFK